MNTPPWSTKRDVLGVADQARVMEDVAVDNEQIGSLAWLDGPNLSLETQQLGICPGCWQ